MGGRGIADVGDGGRWWRRAAHYAYCRDLIAGKRVLEVDCGSGESAAFVAGLGAASVVGVDVRRDMVHSARAVHRIANLEFRCEVLTALDFDSNSFDCVLVPELPAHIFSDAILSELRRVLSTDGVLVASGPSADRVGTVGGASYYHFVERLQRYFSPVHMLAQRPFVGVSLVEFGDGGEPLEVEVDSSICDGDEDSREAIEYVAVCGPAAQARSSLAIVELPLSAGVGLLMLESAPADAVASAPEEPSSVAVEEPGADDRDVEIADLRERLAAARKRIAERDEQLAALRGHAQETVAAERTSARVADAIAELEDTLAEQARVAEEIDRGISDLIASLASEETAVRPPGARASERLRAELAEARGELGVKDAEITILRVGVESLTARLRKVAETVVAARRAIDSNDQQRIERALASLHSDLHRFETPDRAR